jgi:chemotaxis family two-component system sensor kinase Cph1
MTVSDNGIGIDERFKSRIFDMFGRFHPVGEYPGSGVGLALSKRMVECHDGTIAVHPNPSGRGTSITVEVPIVGGETKNPLETGRFLY